MKNTRNEHHQQLALERFAAVSFIKQQREGGVPLSHCLKQAALRPWPQRRYAASTLEEWYYQYEKDGFEALKPKGRKDLGSQRALTPDVSAQLEELRKANPQLTVRTLVRRLLEQGVLQPGEFSLSSVYRHLHRCGLDARSLRLRSELGEGTGPQKAFESAFTNDLWMTDMMHGPTLAVEGKRPVHTRMFAFVDDCSRLCTGAAYYAGESLDYLLDTLRRAIECRGIPRRIYSDNGKVFTCRHLKVVCANLDIRLLHAKPYHSWSKGKVERFFRTVQSDFQQQLVFEPAKDLEELNERFHLWLEKQYHRREHSSLQGESPAQRFGARGVHLRLPGEDLDRLFLHRATRKVRKDATFSLAGILYEVSPSLRGEEIEVHYNPFTGERIEVYRKGHYIERARKLDKVLNSNSSHNYEHVRR
jgi:transposase InsO family protein